MVFSSEMSIYFEQYNAKTAENFGLPFYCENEYYFTLNFWIGNDQEQIEGIIYKKKGFLIIEPSNDILDFSEPQQDSILSFIKSTFLKSKR